MALDVQVNGADDGPATVSVAGDLDLSTALDLERTLARIQREGRAVLLDMRGLSFMDSSGLRVILAADARARSNGTTLMLVAGPPSVQRVFELTLLDRRLEFVDVVDGQEQIES